MDFESNDEISLTADFIRSRDFTRVALQFPDGLLKDSWSRVAKSLRNELGKGVRLFVMADTAYGSCCVDEVAASHADAYCVGHYGHACMSPTPTLPALFVFGKSEIDANDCLECLSRCLSTGKRPFLVLFGLEYAHVLQDIKYAVAGTLPLDSSSISVYYTEVACSSMNPPGNKTGKEHLQSHFGVHSK